MMANVWQFAQTHSGELILLSGIVGTAFASTVPEDRPKTLDEFWAWFRDFVHQLANARRASPKA